MHANHAYDAYEMHAYERYAYEIAYGRCPPMGGRCTLITLMTPTRGTPMRWPMGDARLWEIHAYEMAVYGMHTL
jgi:hypothetical protein